METKISSRQLIMSLRNPISWKWSFYAIKLRDNVFFSKCNHHVVMIWNLWMNTYIYWQKANRKEMVGVKWGHTVSSTYLLTYWYVFHALETVLGNTAKNISMCHLWVIHVQLDWLQQVGYASSTNTKCEKHQSRRRSREHFSKPFPFSVWSSFCLFIALFAPKQVTQNHNHVFPMNR